MTRAPELLANVAVVGALLSLYDTREGSIGNE